MVFIIEPVFPSSNGVLSSGSSVMVELGVGIELFTTSVAA